jgi:glyoxylase-like metal-dependent hydrolase (beta-lactamase superfamily II)
MWTPGHTPACMTYYVKDRCVFVGDTLFMPDMGTARCDFPGGSSETLWNSIQRVLELPKETVVYCCHDYAPGGREYAWVTTIAEERAKNKHVKEGTDGTDFIKWRAERDATLSAPRLILPSLQVNVRAGCLPPAEDGTVFLKIPVNKL